MGPGHFSEAHLFLLLGPSISLFGNNLNKLAVPLFGKYEYPGPFCSLSQTKSQQGQGSCPMVGKAESASSHPQGTAHPLASWHPQRPASPIPTPACVSLASQFKIK